MKKQILLVFIALTLLAGCGRSSNKANMSEYDLLTEKDHVFISGNYGDVMDQLENLEPGIYYFGYPTCPWCRELIPVIQEVAAPEGLSVYVTNISTNNWNLNLNNRLTEFASQFPEDGQYTGVPFVVFVGPDGDVVSHVGTVSTHNAYERLMTDNERAYLNRLLRDAINSVGLTAEN